MNILLVGAGGREHALAVALKQSDRCKRLLCAPGNAGIAKVAECFPVKADDVAGLVALAQDQAVDCVVVGPEVPLTLGLVDALATVGIKAFGPSQAAAVLEGSKSFMKDLCTRHNIPTAAYGCFDDLTAAQTFLAQQSIPVVVKADGLAAGKGVTVAQTREQAEEALTAIFADGEGRVVIEEFLAGEEVSYFVLTDGENILPLTSAQDHKRVGDGDTGPNTGGMGAYSPAPLMTPELEQTVLDTIIKPTVRGMAADGHPYRGVLYAGLMVCDGVPKLLEYNVRFGDPECQVLMARLQSDLVDLLLATVEGTLSNLTPQWSPDPALCVVMATNGYPGAYGKGSVIRGLEDAETVEGVTIFHAGTVQNDKGAVIANGGRVLCITATGATVQEAQHRAYAAVDYIDWPEGFCRRDIGWRVVGRYATAEIEGSSCKASA